VRDVLENRALRGFLGFAWIGVEVLGDRAENFGRRLVELLKLGRDMLVGDVIETLMAPVRGLR
jgi:hypothetical protein